MPVILAFRASSALAAATLPTRGLSRCDLQDSGSDVVALIHGRRIEYRLGAAGEHWVLNSVAALAVVEALGADVGKAAATLADVKASPGRGARRLLKFGTGTIELLDESYNANPVSVRAMLAVLARTEPASRAGGGCWRWATCASWASRPMPITPVSPTRWRRAARHRSSCAGRTCRRCGRSSAPAQRGVHRPDSAALAGEVAAALRAGDVVAVKGSLGSKMKIVVDAIVAASGGEVGR